MSERTERQKRRAARNNRSDRKLQRTSRRPPILLKETLQEVTEANPTCCICHRRFNKNFESHYQMQCTGRCSYCVACFPDFISKPSCTTCKGCDNPVSEYDCIIHKWNVAGDETPHTSEVIAKTIDLGLDPLMDPIRTYHDNHKLLEPTMRTKYAVLAFAGFKEDGGLVQRSVLMPTNGVDEAWTHDQRRDIVTIFKILHSILMQSGDNNDEPIDVVASSSEHALTGLARDDKSIVRDCLFALSMGKRIEETHIGHDLSVILDPGWAKILKSVYAATSILRHVGRETPGVLKQIVSKQLAVHDIPIAVHKLLQGFGVTQEKLTEDRGVSKSLHNLLGQGIDFEKFSKHDYFHLIYDNQGSKVRGGRIGDVGYFQSIQRVFIHLPWKELQKRGIYSDPTNPEKLLSRDNGEKWSNLLGDPDFKPHDVILPGYDEDVRVQNERLKVVECVLEMEEEGVLMSYEEALNNVGADRVPSRKAPSFFHRSADLERQKASEPAEDQDFEDDVHPVKRSLLTSNNAFVDIPAEQDLNSTEAVKALFEYTELARKEILEKCKAAEELEGQEPILESKSIYLCGDGEPSIALKRLRRSDLDCRSLLATFGGFHTEKKGYTLMGSLFGHEGVIGDLHKVGGRNTTKKMNFVCNPGDPNDAERETMIMVYAIMTVAVREVASIKAANGENQVQLTPLDVADHLIARAKRFPAVQMILIFLRLWESISVLNCAEKNADHEDYLTALRLIGGFCTTGHAVGYVSLITDCLRDYYCMSDMEKRLWIMTLFKKSVHGKNIHVDLFEEKIVGQNRTLVGKLALSNDPKRHFRRIRENAVILADPATKIRNIKPENQPKLPNSTAQQSIGSEDTVESEQKEKKVEIELGRKYCEWIIYLFDTGIFSNRQPRKIPTDRKSWRKDASEYEEMKDLECCTLSGNVLNPDACFNFREQLIRWTEYIDKFYVDGDPNDPKRPETGNDGVDLSLLHPNNSKAATKAKLELERSTSENYEYLMKKGVYNAKEIDIDLEYAKKKLPDQIWKQVVAEFGYKKSARKPIKVHTLMKARRELRKLNPDWAEKRKAELQSMTSENEERSSEFFGLRLENEIERYLSLHQEVRDGIIAKGKSYSIKVNNRHLEQVMMTQDTRSTVSTFGATSLNTEYTPNNI